jgi:Tfp pilus assembly protein PilN
MTDINLLQNQVKDTTIIANRRNNVFLVVVSLLVIGILVSGGLLYFLTQKVSDEASQLVADNANLTEQISNVSEEVAAAKIFQAKLSNIQILLDKHAIVTPVLDELEKITYQKSQFINADISIDNDRVHLEGTAPTYPDLAKLLLGLTTSKHYKKVKLLAVTSSTTGGYQFSIDMNLNWQSFLISNNQGL